MKPQNLSRKTQDEYIECHKLSERFQIFNKMWRRKETASLKENLKICKIWGEYEDDFLWDITSYISVGV
jgi:hypothetical protein